MTTVSTYSNKRTVCFALLASLMLVVFLWDTRTPAPTPSTPQPSQQVSTCDPTIPHYPSCAL